MKTKHLSNILLSSLLVALGQAGLSQTKLLDFLQDENAQGAVFFALQQHRHRACRGQAHRQAVVCHVSMRPLPGLQGFDAEVAKNNQKIIRLAQEQIVAVRRVEMNGFDLSQFQFDYDVNWAAMFVNADGTVYERYGTQSAAGADAYNSIASLEKTMRRGLALHEDYPNNKNGLAGKLGKLKPYKTALEMPGMKHRAKRNYEEKNYLTLLRNGKHIQFDWPLTDGD